MFKEVKCFKCKHYFKYAEEIMPKCKAFPNGIPLEIFREETEHTQPYKGDNGIQFEMSED